MKIKPPGLRIFKTFLAVTASMLISYFRPGDGLPFYSAIAAVICLQQDVQNTTTVGLNRILGTLLGGLCGLVYLLIVPAGMLPVWAEIILISFLTSAIIWFMANWGKTKALAIMAIVFLSITINHGGDILPFRFAFNRTFDTMVGVVMAMLINWGDFEIRNTYRRNRGMEEI